ncbi:hypothetical protein WMF45_42325 [Sorangium sp. So ce448]|uniref:hypothetical protein n=1 Tax=Sorangium sp. So ce448 TaxID=3133314 RepID=UPI003F5F931D
MSPVNVYHCQRCIAPLEAPPGSRTIVCRYCGTHNELQRPELQRAVPPGPPVAAPRPAVAPRRTSAAILLGVAIAIAVLVSIAVLAPRGARVPRPFRGPLELEWSNERKFVVKSDEALHGEVAIFEGTYQITFHGFPEGTRWKVGEKSGRIESNIYDIIKLDNVEGQLGRVPVARYRDTLLGPKGKLEIELPSGQAASIELRQADAAMSVLSVLDRVKNGPVVFEGEPKQESDLSSVLLLETASMKIFGQAVLLQDVDLVAITRRLPEIKGRKTCTGYKDRAGEPLPELTIRFKETEATVFDRRTGVVVQKKVFPPDEECPMFRLSIGGDREREQDSYPPTRDIESWLSSLVQR